MRKSIFVGFLFAILGIASTSTAFSATELIKFVPVKSHELLADHTAPRIKIIYSLDCNQMFHRVVREESVNAIGGKVYIHLGVLVVESLLIDCAGPTRDAIANAGSAYSGRDYEINYIKGTNDINNSPYSFIKDFELVKIDVQGSMATITVKHKKVICTSL